MFGSISISTVIIRTGSIGVVVIFVVVDVIAIWIVAVAVPHTSNSDSNNGRFSGEVP